MKASLNKIALFYERALFHTEEGLEALNYLHSRGFINETIKQFGVGYCPSFKVDYIKNKLLTYTEIDRLTELEHLYKNGSKYADKFNGRITFPVRNTLGEVTGFAARCLDEERMKYVNSADSLVYKKGTEVFGLDLSKEAIYDENRVILSEGYTDAMAFHQTGIRFGVACGGTYATERQLLAFSRYTNNVILAFDHDVAGSEATSRTIKLINKMGLNLQLLKMSEGKDPADSLLAGSDII